MKLVIHYPFTLVCFAFSLVNSVEVPVTEDEPLPAKFSAYATLNEADDTYLYISTEGISRDDIAYQHDNMTIKLDSVLSKDPLYASNLEWDSKENVLYTLIPGLFEPQKMYLIVNETSQELGWSSLIERGKNDMVHPTIDREKGAWRLGEFPFYHCEYALISNWPYCPFPSEQYDIYIGPAKPKKVKPSPTVTDGATKPTYSPISTDNVSNKYEGWAADITSKHFANYINCRDMTEGEFYRISEEGSITKSIDDLRSNVQEYLSIDGSQVSSISRFSKRLWLGVDTDGVVGWTIARRYKESIYVSAIPGAFSNSWQIGESFFVCNGKVYVPDAGCDSDEFKIFLTPVPQ